MTEPADKSGKRLTVHNASVTTMTVEVKTLTIGARQVTQGIFRQLIEQPLIAVDGTLNGTPWGHVTWHPDKCDGFREHWHIVWQYGSELRRARIPRVPDFDANLRTGGSQIPFWCIEADRSMGAAVREWVDGRRDTSPLVPKPGFGTVFHDRYAIPTEQSFSVYAVPSDLAVAAAKAKLSIREAAESLKEASERLSKPLGEYERQEYRESTLATAKTRLTDAQSVLADARKQLDDEVGCATHDEIAGLLDAAIQGEAERRQRHRDVHAALAQLPQLFIGG